MASATAQPDPDRLVGVEELRHLFPQLILSAVPGVTAEQLAAAQRAYDQELRIIAGARGEDHRFTIDQATEALGKALDRLE